MLEGVRLTLSILGAPPGQHGQFAPQTECPTGSHVRSPRRLEEKV